MSANFETGKEQLTAHASVFKSDFVISSKGQVLGVWIFKWSAIALDYREQHRS